MAVGETLAIVLLNIITSMTPGRPARPGIDALTRIISDDVRIDWRNPNET
jgi:hypothetical protein